MATIPILDANGTLVNVELPLTVARKSAALSRPVVLSTEDLAAIAALATTANQDEQTTILEAISTAFTSLNGFVDGLETLIGATNSALTAATLPVGAGAESTAGRITQARPATGTQSSVADSASSVTILASNVDRMGAHIFNDSEYALYILLGGATASLTTFTEKLAPGGSLSISPSGFTGLIVGIWAANGSGSARVTEWTP